MFGKRIECPPVGSLKGEGNSKVWEGTLDCAVLGGAFFLRIHGAREGPTPEQVRALQRLLDNAPSIRGDATQPAAELVQPIVPPDVVVDETNIWTYASPSFAEVHPPTLHPSGEIGIALGYAIPWDDEHLLQIGTVNARFDAVYAE